MKTWHFVVAATAILGMIGCRTNPKTTLLEQENRRLEDEVYRLRWALEDCGTVASRTGPNLAAPGRYNPGAATNTGGSSVPRTFRGGAPAASSGPLQVDLGEQMQEGEQPKIFAPNSPGASPGPAPDTNRPTPTPPPQKRSDEAPRFQPKQTRQLTPPGDSRKVELITFKESSCGGYNADGRPGDEGIRLVLELRDGRGRILDAPGEVVVVALDPALEGEAARVARWDFPADEIARRFRNGGIRLEALWPTPPKHNDLQLFVRYTTRDGRRIEAEHPIRIALLGEPPKHWSPTEPRPMPTVKPAPDPEPGPNLQAGQPLDSSNPLTPQVRLSQRSASAANATPKVQPPAWSPYRNR
jgi:hypothetical protein